MADKIFITVMIFVAIWAVMIVYCIGYFRGFNRAMEIDDELIEEFFVDRREE